MGIEPTGSRFRNQKTGEFVRSLMPSVTSV
jgi:hypothetical protein